MKFELVGLPRVGWSMQYYGGSPKDANTTFKQPSFEVASGDVAKLELVDWAGAFSICRRVMGEMRIDNSRTTTSFTSMEAFDVTCYAIHRNQADWQAAIDAGRVNVPVHEKYQGKLWVTTSPPINI